MRRVPACAEIDQPRPRVRPLRRKPDKFSLSLYFMPSFLYCEVFFDKKWKKYQQKSYYPSTNIPYLPRKNNRHPLINIISYKKKICFPSSKYQKKLEKGNHSIQDKNKHFFSLSHLIFVGKRCQVPPTECLTKLSNFLLTTLSLMFLEA